MSKKSLEGLSVAILATDGFEQVELTVPRAALEDEGATVKILSLHKGKIRGVNKLCPGKRICVDDTVKKADPKSFDALLIPGGLANPDALRECEDARKFVMAMDQAGKPIAAICHAPWVLASAGLVKGRRLTSWPNIKTDLVNAGAIWTDEPTVRDGNLLSSRGPQDLRAFNKALIELFAESAQKLPHRVAERAPSFAARLFKRAVVSGISGITLYGLSRLARRLRGSPDTDDLRDKSTATAGTPA